jgi:hypothetical protein
MERFQVVSHLGTKMKIRSPGAQSMVIVTTTGEVATMPTQTKTLGSWAAIVLLSVVSAACSSSTDQTISEVESSEPADASGPVDHSEPMEDTGPVDPISTAFPLIARSGCWRSGLSMSTRPT